MKAITCLVASLGFSVSAQAGEAGSAAPWAGSLIVAAKSDTGFDEPSSGGARITPALPSQSALPDRTPDQPRTAAPDPLPDRGGPALKVEAVPPKTSMGLKVSALPNTTIVPKAEALKPEASKPESPKAEANRTGNLRKRIVTTGYASYYRTGRITASGERFLPLGLTAAHRTLPFGTKLLVTNKKTGKSVVVRINDRGPFLRGRSIDLTVGAARVIGLDQAGVASVIMEQQ